MDDVAKLLAIEAIKTLKARYFRYVDTKNWEGLRSVFAPEAKIEFPENFDEPFAPDPFVDMVAKSLASATSVHHGHMPEIEILSEDTAKGIWALYDILTFPEGDAGLAGVRQIEGQGHYHETYRRIGGEWLIDTLRLTRLRLVSESHSRVIT